MTRAANKHRRKVEYAVVDQVYLMFRPFRQASLFRSQNRKLAPRYFGPYQIIERIGAVPYRLKLPKGSRLHPVFHVSLLKKAIGDAMAENPLPDDVFTHDPPFLPEVILDNRVVRREGRDVEQRLVKWLNLPDEDASWMDVDEIRGQFPYFRLVDKAVSPSGKVDMDQAEWQVYKSGKQAVTNWD